METSLHTGVETLDDSDQEGENIYDIPKEASSLMETCDTMEHMNLPNVYDELAKVDAPASGSSHLSISQPHTPSSNSSQEQELRKFSQSSPLPPVPAESPPLAPVPVESPPLPPVPVESPPLPLVLAKSPPLPPVPAEVPLVPHAESPPLPPVPSPFPPVAASTSVGSPIPAAPSGALSPEPSSPLSPSYENTSEWNRSEVGVKYSSPLTARKVESSLAKHHPPPHKKTETPPKLPERPQENAECIFKQESPEVSHPTRFQVGDHSHPAPPPSSRDIEASDQTPPEVMNVYGKVTTPKSHRSLAANTKRKLSRSEDSDNSLPGHSSGGATTETQAPPLPPTNHKQHQPAPSPPTANHKEHHDIQRDCTHSERAEQQVTIPHNSVSKLGKAPPPGTKPKPKASPKPRSKSSVSQSAHEDSVSPVPSPMARTRIVSASNPAGPVPKPRRHMTDTRPEPKAKTLERTSVQEVAENKLHARKAYSLERHAATDVRDVSETRPLAGIPSPRLGRKKQPLPQTAPKPLHSPDTRTHNAPSSSSSSPKCPPSPGPGVAPKPSHRPGSGSRSRNSSSMSGTAPSPPLQPKPKTAARHLVNNEHM